MKTIEKREMVRIAIGLTQGLLLGYLALLFCDSAMKNVTNINGDMKQVMTFFGVSINAAFGFCFFMTLTRKKS